MIESLLVYALRTKMADDGNLILILQTKTADDGNYKYYKPNWRMIIVIMKMADGYGYHGHCQR